MSNLALSESTNLFQIDSNQAVQITEKVIAENGDLYKLTAVERKVYYLAMCNRYGLDPFSSPFDYLSQTIKEKIDEGGKKIERWRDRVTLYPNQRASNFFAQKHRISTDIVKREFSDGMWIVDVIAKRPDGQFIKDCGVVKITERVTKDVALKKAISQGRRRAILALCGFSTEDEFVGETTQAQAYDIPIEVLESTGISDAVPEPEAFDREPTNAAIERAILDLGWSQKQAKESLENFTGKRSRQNLTDGELISFCDFLESQVRQVRPAIADAEYEEIDQSAIPY